MEGMAGDGLRLGPFAFGASLLDSGDEFRGSNAESVTDAEQHVNGRRFLVILQLTDVGSVKFGLEGQLLLAQFRCFSGFA